MIYEETLPECAIGDGLYKIWQLCGQEGARVASLRLQKTDEEGARGDILSSLYLQE